MSSTKRPHESRSAGIAYLIFASTRIRCDAAGSDSTIHTNTLLRFTFANYWPVQLPVSMLKRNLRLWFRGICKCCCGYIEHTWAQWAGLPICCLYHAPVRALDEPKAIFEDPEEESFARFRLELKHSTIWIWLSLVLKWLTVVVKIAAEGR